MAMLGIRASAEHKRQQDATENHWTTNRTHHRCRKNKKEMNDHKNEKKIAHVPKKKRTKS